MTGKFAALKASEHKALDFWGNDDPKCPHCGQSINISQHDLGELYEEGEHTIDCPYCEREFQVTTRVSFSFSTDEQDMDEAEP